MGYVNLIYSATIANANGDGPWTDVSQRGTEWSIHILQTDGSALGTFSIEVSSQINQPYTYNIQPPVVVPQYPPNAPPMSITTYTETHAISAVAPYTFTVTHAPTGVQTFTDGGVQGYTSTPSKPDDIYLSDIAYYADPSTGTYTFDAANAGKSVTVTYSISAPAVGVIVPASYIITDATNHQALVIAKSDLNVKWVRVRQAAPGTTVAFLHTKG